MLVLQRINGNVFPDPAAVILNAAAVAEYLEKTGESHRTISYLKNDEGEYYTVDSGGGFWRAYRYIPHSCCFKKPSGARNFRLVGEAFGGFLNALSGFDAALLRDTGRFHDTATRYRHFEASVKEDREGRAHEVQREIDFCVSRKKTAGVYSEGGELPRMRVIHGDTKISNVLFDTETGLPRALSIWTRSRPGTRRTISETAPDPAQIRPWRTLRNLRRLNSIWPCSAALRRDFCLSAAKRSRTWR